MSPILPVSSAHSTLPPAEGLPRGGTRFQFPAAGKLLAIILCVASLFVAVRPGLGYVVPSQKVLSRWVAARGPARGPSTLPIRWGDRLGTLYVGGAGSNALVLDGEYPQRDPGPAAPHPLAALWLALDLFTAPTVESLTGDLTEAGVDLGRSGYARTAISRDGVGFTVGARGEGEPDLPQVHFAREPVWPVRARVGDQVVEIGGMRPDGWPLWIEFEDGSYLEFGGPARPSLAPPSWALVPPTPAPPSPQLPDWRRAFEGVRP